MPRTFGKIVVAAFAAVLIGGGLFYYSGASLGGVFSLEAPGTGKSLSASEEKQKRQAIDPNVATVDVVKDYSFTAITRGPHQK